MRCETDETSGVIYGKRQANFPKLLDTQQAMPIQSQPLPTSLTPMHIPIIFDASLQPSIAAVATFSITLTTIPAPYDTSATSHPLLMGAWTHPHMYMTYNTHVPSLSYLPASQITSIPGTTSTLPCFPGTSSQPSNGHNLLAPFFHPFFQFNNPSCKPFNARGTKSCGCVTVSNTKLATTITNQLKIALKIKNEECVNGPISFSVYCMQN